MKNRRLTLIYLFCALAATAWAQTDFNNNEDSQFAPQTNRKVNTDSLGSDKEIPKGIRVWTVDERFGDVKPAEVDTLPHLYMNTTFTEGLRGEYNTLGNMGSPRIGRIFVDRTTTQGQFLFAEPYAYFIGSAADFHFTNTYSPITNLTYNTCGNRTNGEDDFKVKFAVNGNKQLGGGFLFDYKYGRGYYNAQSTSHFKYGMWLSYQGDRYQAHLLFTTLHQKVTENGGITEDNYVKHPEIYEETFTSSEIPTVLEKNWNRNNSQHIFLSHRYNIGFNRKVRMTEEEIKAKKFALASQKDNADEKAKEQARLKAKREGKDFDEDAFDKQNSKQKFAGRPADAKIAGAEPAAAPASKDTARIAVSGKAAADSLLAVGQKAAEDTAWLKNEYVPVTSFIHTLKFDNYSRVYQAYQTPTDYYLNEYYTAGKYQGDSIYDETRHWDMKNTLAIAMLEGFNKWAKAGLKVFASYDLRHFELPDGEGGITKYNEHSLYVGGQLSKRQGRLLHYNAVAEIGVVGEDIGTMAIDGSADLNVPFLGDTLAIKGDAFIHRENPSFYYRKYHARHLWWENSMDKIFHTRLMGTLHFGKTGTTLCVAVDEIKNYAYFSQSYTITDAGLRQGVTVTPMQSSSPVSLLTAQLQQNFKWGILHWENTLTYQNSSKQDVIPVPALNVYSNLYLKFRVAKVLNIDFGADVRYFTEYEVPDYSPYMGQYAVQGNGASNVKTGNYPLLNAYINAHIKHTRIFVMMSNITTYMGGKNYIFTPHYPLNECVFRFGLSWNFFN